MVTLKTLNMYFMATYKITVVTDLINIQLAPAFMLQFLVEINYFLVVNIVVEIFIRNIKGLIGHLVLINEE